jgi:hypothetical protein
MQNLQKKIIDAIIEMCGTLSRAPDYHGTDMIGCNESDLMQLDEDQLLLTFTLLTEEVIIYGWSSNHIDRHVDSEDQIDWFGEDMED